MRPVTLIIPCKDEAERLEQSVILEAVEKNPALSILFVNDGSRDGTSEILAHLVHASPAIAAIHLSRNVGKAEAVRAGVKRLLQEDGEGLIGFWDADLATPLEDVERFVSVFERDSTTEMVVGSRWPHLGASVERTGFRDFSGQIMKFLIRRVLRAPVYDTQCGAKIFTRQLARDVFAGRFLSPWLFDVEMFRRMGKRRILKGVKELPLECWRDIAGSKMTLGGAMRSVLDLVRIAWSTKMVEYTV